MWADVAERPAPLDLGHGGIKSEPTRWSPWLSREAAIEDLQLYRTADNLGRPVEARIAAARGHLSRDEVEGRILPGSRRFLSRFANVDEAIDYLSRGGAALRLRWKEPASSTSKAPPAPAPMATPADGPRGRGGGAGAGGDAPGGAGTSEEATREIVVVPASIAPSAGSPPPRPGRGEPDKAGAGPGVNVGSVIGYVGYLGFLPCLAFAGWLGFRLMWKRECRDVVTSAGEEESSNSDSDRIPGAPNPWQAFMGAPREGEMRRLLLFAEEGPREGLRELPPLPDEGDRAPANPAMRPLAEAEVERILATREPGDIFGPGGAASMRQEFLRILRLIHPDKGLVSGERASLALRRLVEAYRSLASGEGVVAAMAR